MSQVTGVSSSGGEPTSVPELLGLQPNYRRAAMFRDIKDRVLAMNNSSHVHPVLLVDEAHLLSPDILAGIRLRVNFEIDSLNALTVILCGSEMLTRKFGLSHAVADIENHLVAGSTRAQSRSGSYWLQCPRHECISRQRECTMTG